MSDSEDSLSLTKPGHKVRSAGAGVVEFSESEAEETKECAKEMRVRELSNKAAEAKEIDELKRRIDADESIDDDVVESRNNGLFAKNISEPLKRFIADSKQFLSECESPAIRPTAGGKQGMVPDFLLIAGVTGVGFVAFGVIAFIVKVVHAPITQILLG